MYKSGIWKKPLELLRRKTVCLWLAFCFGLLLGFLCAVKENPSYFSVMRLAAGCRMSIVGLCASLLLPFLLAVYAASNRLTVLLYLVCGCKAFGFAYIGHMARRAFGSAGWLIQPMLQFHQILFLPVLCGFCLRYTSGSEHTVKRDALICLGLLALIAGVAYFVVSPFLAGLID